jgi:gamma-tubulin complex component 2
MFASYTGSLSRELERADEDLIGTERSANMNQSQWARYQTQRSQRQGDAAHPPPNATDRQARLERMYEIIKKQEYHFSRHLQILLDALNHYAATETVVLLGLCARLSTANQGTEFSGLRADEDARVQA